jgi:hypothetical protein
MTLGPVSALLSCYLALWVGGGWRMSKTAKKERISGIEKKN